jgi:branched-chain amino acid transport system permease protein
MATAMADTHNEGAATLWSSLGSGLLSAGISISGILMGLPSLVGALVQDWLELRSLAPGAWILIVGLALWGGAATAGRLHRRTWMRSLASGVVAGVGHGLLMAVVTWGLGSLVEAGADVRKWLVQLTPDAVRLLTLSRAAVPAAFLMGLYLLAASVAGALVSCLARRHNWRDRVRGCLGTAREKLAGVAATGPLAEGRWTRLALMIVGLLVLLAAPAFLGRYWNNTLGTVGIYVMLGLGLNVVVGMAGLLDLGYAAFFAIGGYTVALLTAPEPHGVMLDFWLVLPIGVVLAALTGVLLGIPVLRMRGDYLAIVTLGFGEIIRLLLKSDALTSFTGGPQGVLDVARPSVLGHELNTQMYFLYFIILGIILVAFLTSRLRGSRVGRAWMAMREDEDVAEAMGIHTLKYKLLAFAVGAAFAGLGGVIYASRNQYAGPENFNLLVSVNVLCLVIIGGMGSIPGVVMGAIVLKGLPEVLRELDDYRMLAFGALLIVMMILRPEGLWPSKRIRMELSAGSEQPGKAGAAPEGDR